MKIAIALYALATAGMTVWLASANDPPLQPCSTPDRPPLTTEDDTHMSINWTETKDNIVVPAQPAGLWTPVFDYIKGPAVVKIEATGTWMYSPGKTCGPDGDRSALLSADQTIAPTHPVGALLAKIGGSTAGLGDGTVSVAGSMALITVAGTVSGPIFLTINDAAGGFGDNSGKLTVKVSIAQLAADPPAPPPASAPAAAARAAVPPTVAEK